jgi:chemotaxis protein MotA
MHIILGALIVGGSFLLAMNYITDEFQGFWNLYSLILLAGVPVGLTFIAFQFSMIGKGFKGLWRAIVKNQRRERDRIAQSLVDFGREVRREKGTAATAALERESDPVFRALGRHVVQRTHTDEIEADAMIVGRRDLEDFRLGERMFAALGDFAPAMGMIGTVIGLIQLLANMRDFEKLGPGMAIALLTTFYGLVLAHLIYLPIARMIAAQGAERAENINLIVEGMLKLARKRPLHEVQQMVQGEKNSRAA